MARVVDVYIIPLFSLLGQMSRIVYTPNLTCVFFLTNSPDAENVGAMADDEFRAEVAKKLEQGLKAKECSKVDFAKRVGISRQALYNYLKKKNTPSSKRMHLFCKELDIEIEYGGRTYGASDFAASGQPSPIGVQLPLDFREIRPDQLRVRLGRKAAKSVEFIIQVKIA